MRKDEPAGHGSLRSCCGLALADSLDWLITLMNSFPPLAVFYWQIKHLGIRFLGLTGARSLFLSKK